MERDIVTRLGTAALEPGRNFKAWAAILARKVDRDGGGQIEELS